MGVPPLEWLVYFMENTHLEMDDDLGGTATYFRKPSYMKLLYHENISMMSTIIITILTVMMMMMMMMMVMMMMMMMMLMIS